MSAHRRSRARIWLGDWYEQLEAWDVFLLVLVLGLALALLVPWRKEMAQDASVRPREGELLTLLSPGQGIVKDLFGEKGRVLAAGDVFFSFIPLADPLRYTPQPQSQANAGYLFQSASMEEERRIRERYAQQVAEAYTLIRSTQEQLERAYREQTTNRRSGLNYDAQLAQNALRRAQEMPGELNRRMEQELAQVRQDRDASNRALLPGAIQRSASVEGASGEISVTVGDRVFVWSQSLNRGTRVAANQECASVLPEGAALEIRSAVPAAFAAELRAGLPATLEVLSWLHDSEAVPLRLASIGNRTLDADELASLVKAPKKETPYVLVSFEQAVPDGRLFPPPGKCRVHLTGGRRCLLQRLLF